MLAIRMQRTGRKGHAMFRVIVQDSRLTPTSGKVVAQLGSYDPHAKTVSFDKEKAAFYLSHGAQPSDRVARLFKSEGVKLPDWVSPPANKERSVRHAEKRRSTRPAEEAKKEVVSEAPAVEAAEAEEVIATEASEETSAEAAEVPNVETATEETEASAEEATEVATPEATETSATAAEEKPDKKPDATPAEADKTA